MNKFAKYLIIPMVCLASNFAYAANIKDYPRVAVMDFGNKAITSRGLRGHDMAMATEYAIYQLSASGWFDLIDYEQLNSIAQMHRINMSGLIDQGTAVQMGKIAGAQFMVIGNVTGLTTKENIAGVRAYTANANNAQHVVNANVTVRIVDIETGRIVAAGIGKGSSTSTMTEFGFTKYRNRKVESENIYNSVANNVVDEYVKKKGSKYDESYSDYKNDRVMSGTQSGVNTETINETNKINDKRYDNKDYGEEHSKEEQSYTKGSTGKTNQNKSDTYTVSPDKTDVKFVSIEGDINEDGQIDEKDFKAIEYYFMRGKTNGHFSEKNADVDGDGKITIKDAWEVRKIVDGLYYQTYKHIVGDVDSAEPYGEVTESDVNRLKNYLVGNRDDYINILEADMNGDGYITLTDLAILKEYVGTFTKKYIGNMYQSLPQKYWDYNKNHGIVVTKEEGKLQQTGSTINSGNDTSSYYDESNDLEKEWTKGYINSSKGQDYINNYKYDSEEVNISENNLSDSNSISTSSSANSGYMDEAINKADNQSTISSSSKNIYYERDAMNYSVVIGTVEVSDVQVRNAISKAVRDAIYGKTGIMTVLNNGKQLKIKTGF